MTHHVLLINGPNLNLLGTREPSVYGTSSLASIEADLGRFFEDRGGRLTAFQSNHEGAIIDHLHQHRGADYLIINPGGLTHTSVALRDALAATAIPFIEVHISNTQARESFRHHSYLSAIAAGLIIGCGVYGYRLAAELIIHRLSSSS
jgi:3-dehydroquinate dehydratase II